MRGRLSMARLGMLALLLMAASVSATLAAGASADSPGNAIAAGQDSPWPDTNAIRPNVRAVQREIKKLEFQVELMEASVARYEDWETCLSYVPVSEYGDPWDARYGYLYDERDGTGVGYMDALAVDPQNSGRESDYKFIHFAGEGCRSTAPLPGGTAEPASRQRPSAAARGTGETEVTRAARSRSRGRSASMPKLRRLERKAARLFRRVQALETASERFDEWESCVSWVPVTEQGGAGGTFGYLFGSAGSAPGYRPALHIDRSDWDDPDYQFLALVGGDRPGGECQDEPGEAPD
jgi:hypothetical protein